VIFNWRWRSIHLERFVSAAQIISPRTSRTATLAGKNEEPAPMFAFFSNRLGCLGSIAVSIIGTVLLIVLMRGCHF
jgi:hypothetical protein